jgi:hypothetical protein
MAHPRETTRSTREDVILVDSVKQSVKLKFELRNRSRTLSNHYDCLSLLTVRASLVVENLGLARRMTSWILSEKLIVATRLITVGNGGFFTTVMLRLDRGKQTRAPHRWHARLQAASSLNVTSCRTRDVTTSTCEGNRGTQVLKLRETRKYTDQASWCKYRGISTRQEFPRGKVENIVPLQQSE